MPCSGLPPKRPGSLAILSLAALLRPVSPRTLALYLPLSIGCVMGDGALRRSFNPAGVLPSCPAGVVGSSSVLTPLLARPLALTLVAFSSHSFDRWYLTHWCFFEALSASSSASGTSRTNAFFGGVNWADDISSLGQVIVGFPFGLGHLRILANLSRLSFWWRFSGAPSPGGMLYTEALRRALGCWCYRQWCSSSALLLANRLFPSYFFNE